MGNTLTKWPTETELKILLLRKGITQAQIAWQINRSKAVVSRTLSGQRKSEKTRTAIAGVIGIKYQPPTAA